MSRRLRRDIATAVWQFVVVDADPGQVWKICFLSLTHIERHVQTGMVSNLKFQGQLRKPLSFWDKRGRNRNKVAMPIGGKDRAKLPAPAGVRAGKLNFPGLIPFLMVFSSQGRKANCYSGVIAPVPVVNRTRRPTRDVPRNLMQCLLPQFFEEIVHDGQEFR